MPFSNSIHRLESDFRWIEGYSLFDKLILPAIAITVIIHAKGNTESRRCYFDHFLNAPWLEGTLVIPDGATDFAGAFV